MNTPKIKLLLRELGRPKRDGKWHIMTTITVAKTIRSGKRKGQVLTDECMVWEDMKPLVYKKVIEHLSGVEEKGGKG